MRRTSSRTNADSPARRRLLYAVAFAIGIHEVAAGLWPSAPSPPPPPQVLAERVILERPRPKPTPRPTPPPTPLPTPRITPAPHSTIAPRVAVRRPSARAVAAPTRKPGGAAARRPIVHVIVPPRATAAPTTLAAIVPTGQQNGDTGPGAAPGAGTGGLGGQGAGSGTQGNGNGDDANTAPCGEVILEPGRLWFRRNGSVLQQVFAKVIARDGTYRIGLFPYPFFYANERFNPFVHEDMRDHASKNGGISVQQPPSGMDIAQMPLAVQIVLAHTDPATGATYLKPCPGMQQ